MKKLLAPDYLPFLTLLGGLLGVLCRLWTFGDGPSIENLYAPQPVAWTLLWLVSGLTAAAIFFGSRSLTTDAVHGHSYPRSLTAAIGNVAGALGILSVAVPALSGGADVLSTVGSVLGVLAGICLLVVAVLRYQGKQPSFLLHVPACLFMACYLFTACRGWSDLSQLGVFLMPFLALTFLMLAAFQKTTFDVDLGDRKKSLFWSLISAYLCIISLADQTRMLFFGCMVVWMITDLPSLRALPVEEEQPVTENE